MIHLEQYRSLIHKARKQERYGLIDYLRYRMQNRRAIYTEVKNNVSIDGMKILKTVEMKRTKKVAFSDFLKLNAQRICIN